MAGNDEIYRTIKVLTNSIELVSNRVRRVEAQIRGGSGVLVGTTVERNAHVPGEDGTEWYDTGDDSLYIWHDGAWVLVGGAQQNIPIDATYITVTSK